MARIFHVRLNLDELSAHNDTFGTDQERGEWLRGFLTGARGAVSRFTNGSPGALGYELGESALTHAREFSAVQSEKGKLSAKARTFNRRSTVVQPPLIPGSTSVQPNLNLSNNLIIEEENNLTIESVRDPLAQQIEDIFATDKLIAEKIKSEPMVYSWQDWRRDHPRIGIARTGEDGDMEAWRDLWKIYGRVCFDGMYSHVLPGVADGKRIWYAQAADWLNKNTRAIP